MKARDVIPGWPRGKSTSFPTLFMPPNPIQESILQRTWTTSEYTRLLIERVGKSAYHLGQLEMLNSHMRDRARLLTSQRNIQPLALWNGRRKTDGM